MMDVNWLAVLACAIVSMIVGSLWYGPLFGKPWTKMIGFTKEEMEKRKKEMPKTYAMMFAGSLLTSFVLAVTISMAPVVGLMTGVTAAFWLWLGFVVPVKMGDVLFEKKQWNLFYIEIGYYAAFLLIAGAILGSWV